MSKECKIVLTDDLKIQINKAIMAFKAKDEKLFGNAIKYIFKKIKYSEYDVFCEYLYKKLDLIPFASKNKINRLEEKLQQTNLLLEGQKIINESLRQRYKMRAEY